MKAWIRRSAEQRRTIPKQILYELEDEADDDTSSSYSDELVCLNFIARNGIVFVAGETRANEFILTDYRNPYTGG